jgi:hypothetical protein
MADDARLEHMADLRDNMPLFAEECLIVRGKDTNLGPFVLNEAQLYVHERLEAQRREHGFIRALILKGRQQGISTYVAGRYYQRVSTRKGVSVYILAHEQPASDNLFNIVDRYQRNNPLAPHVGISNTKELIFDRLDSAYAVATAGTKAGGRSRATSLFHGSEVAFWANAPDHFAASVQGVPLEADTEVILESTSAGPGGEFYERWLDAEAGRGDYIAIFLPWWLSKEYSRTPPPDFELAKEAVEEGEMSELEYAETYKLSDAQMYWRRNKTIELRDPALFKREYPADPAEAWTETGAQQPFISALAVTRARKRERAPVGPLIIGVDPASNGGDRFSISARRGKKVLWTLYRNKINHLEGTAWVRELIDTLNPARVNIDAGNIGADIIVSLQALGHRYGNVVRAVNFAATSETKMAMPDRPGPKNRRAEMWKRMSEWISDAMGGQIPDDSALQTDLCAPRLKPLPNNDFLLESKLEMKKRRVRSPDLADSIALTFAFSEFFETYQQADRTPALFGSPDSLQAEAEYVYSPPPVNGSTGWMGVALWGFLVSSLLPPLLHLSMMGA